MTAAVIDQQIDQRLDRIATLLEIRRNEERLEAERREAERLAKLNLWWMKD